MLDDFTREFVLNGTWEGYYDHDNKAYSSKNFPITAMIEQDGTSFRGIMIDGVTDFWHDYRTIIEANRGKMSAFAEHDAWQTLEKYPDFKIVSSLPESSRLQGKIIGDTASFTKTYLGPHSVYGDYGAGRMLIRRVDRHCVMYQGTLNPTKDVIEGKWTIKTGGVLGLFRRTAGTGGFQLFRKK